MIKTYISDIKNLERNNFLVILVRFFAIPILNSLPASSLRKLMKHSSDDSATVLEHVGSAKAMEVMYGRYNRKIFSRGLRQGLADLFWHHFVAQPRGVRNRFKIVKNNLEKAVNNILNSKNKNAKEISLLTIGGGSARSIIEVLNKYSSQLKDWRVSVINIDNSPHAIELGKKLAKEFNMSGNFKWINDVAKNIKLLIKDNSIDIVEMIGLLDYFDDENAVEALALIHNTLKKNGVLIVGNIIPNNEQSFITKIDWPKMYFRTSRDLSELLIKAGFIDNKGEIIIEPLQNHNVAVIKK